jgi:hypothetical protein
MQPQEFSLSSAQALHRSALTPPHDGHPFQPPKVPAQAFCDRNPGESNQVKTDSVLLKKMVSRERIEPPTY